MKIAIVGAGISGVVSAKVLAQYGHDVTIFERKGRIGGVWETSRRHAGLKLQSPKEAYVLSDHDMPASYPEHPSALEIAQYIEGYATQFHLHERTKLQTEVRGFEKRPDGKAGWHLRLADARTGISIDGFTCDHVVVCNGLFSTPVMPEIPGRPDFEAAGGQVLHSTEFADPATVAGQDIIVVGFGKSALDIADACLAHARRVTLVCRQTMWHWPARIWGLLPTKNIFLNRQAESLYELLRASDGKPWYPLASLTVDTIFWVMQVLMGSSLGMLRAPLRPPLSFRKSSGWSTSYGVDKPLRAINRGEIGFRKGAIQSLAKGAATLSTGETLPASTIVFATGFKQDLALLSDAELSTLLTDEGDFRLYRNMICPELPAMSFNGYNVSNATPLTCEVAAHWIGHWLGGQLDVPSRDAMNASIDADLAWRRAQLPGFPIHGNASAPFMFGYLDALLADMGKPPVDKALSWLRRQNRNVTPSDYAFLNETAARLLEANRPAVQ